MSLNRQHQNQFIVELFQKHAARLDALAQRRLSTSSLSKDIVQEAFLIACERVDEVSVHENPGGWLTLTVINLCNCENRKAKRRNEVILERQEFERIPAPTPEPAPPTFAELIPESAPSAEREILRMQYEQGCTVKEISQRFGITETAVRKRISRALASVRKNFEYF